MHLDDLTRNAPLSGPSQHSPPISTRGLVLMGGGARTAYQAGALQALAQLLAAEHRQETSASALSLIHI
jgi:NTE family protein